PCTCTDMRRDKYRARLSGPLLDRFDMRLVITRLAPDALMEPQGEASAPIQKRVLAARKRQYERGTLNRDLSRDQLDAFAVSDSAKESLRALAREPAMTARGWDRVRKVGRTLADLGGTDVVDEQHIAEAASLRGEWR
ncbi:MAG: ATP-binding protein, partial [Actinomycetia bacterium]|nr:ATP-binding protein [Actinomycetes bacterium]